MKSNVIILVILAAGFWALLPSCSNPEQQESNKQETTMQQPAEGNQAAIAKETEEEEEEEDDDDDENEGMEAGKGQKAAPAADAKATVITNLTDAFKGETTASAKYAAYAKKAQEEGFPQIAMLFKAASTSENIHANNHKAVLEDMGASVPTLKPEFTVKTTAENLKDAISGESYEITTMYPQFISNAQPLGNQLALISLNYAYKTEQRHRVLYEKALAALEGNKVNTLESVYYLCPTCGNTFEGKAAKRCNISMTNSDRFIKIDKMGA